MENASIRKKMKNFNFEMVEESPLETGPAPATKEVRYFYSIKPLGEFMGGFVVVPSDATKEEIEQAILEKCEFKITIY